MMDHRIRALVFLGHLGLVSLAGCGEDASTGRATAATPVAAKIVPTPVVPAPTVMPTPPLAIDPPPAPSKTFQGQDLATVDPGELASAASGLAREGRYADAVQLQHWAVAADDHGRYNLACYQAKAGKKDAAFYWLQQAATKDGVDSEWAVQDSDLAGLRGDGRWGQVAPFLASCNAYWAASGLRQTTLVLPKGYVPGKTIGAVVGMHGMSSNPGDFVDESLQPFADALGMAFVGVSGTVPRGARSFVWSEDVSRDAEQVRQALQEVSDRVTIGPGQVVTFGFSQGAQMALEVAFRFPGEFRGAIAMSPGTSKSIDFSGLAPTPGNRAQGYVCLCGAQELPGNIANTRKDADFVRKAGSRVELKVSEGQDQHTFPPDFVEQFPGWVRFVRGEDAKK